MENATDNAIERVTTEPVVSQVKGIEAFAEVKRLIVVAAHPDDLEC